MTPETSSAAVALHAPASQYVGRRPVHRLSRPATTFTPGGEGAVAVRGFRRLVSGLGDVVGFLAVAYGFPLAILAVGIPVALLAQLVLRLVGAL